jgi:hypothetical protein
MGKISPRVTNPGEQNEDAEEEFNSLSTLLRSYTKMQSPGDLVEHLCKKGSISDTELFEFFPNRRIALDWIRAMTAGRGHRLTWRIENGQRIYFCTKYCCPDRLVCGQTPRGARP